MRIRLAGPGWETFTGPLGMGVFFEDGVSVDHVGHMDRNRIAATMHVVDHDTGDQIGPAVNQLAGMGVPAKVEIEAQREADRVEYAAAQALAAELEAAAAAETEVKLIEAAKVHETEEAPIFTRDELEAVGRNEGIAGLRAIAVRYPDVKAASISDMVEKIVVAQRKAA